MDLQIILPLAILGVMLLLTIAAVFIRRTIRATKVFFLSPAGKIYRYELPQAEWEGLEEEAVHTLRLNIFGRVMEINPVKKQEVEMLGQRS